MDLVPSQLCSGSGKPRITVAAIAEKDGRFLLVEEFSQGEIVVNQPAGHLENGETLLAAVARETLEETGWSFEPKFLIGIYLWQPSPDTDAYLRLAFGGAATHHYPERALDEGIVRPIWLAREELIAHPQRPRSPLVLRNIEDYLAGQRFPLDVVLHVD